MSQNANPIQSVDGVAIPCPTKYDWKLSDVSSPDAGRTEDGLMHKDRIAQKVHIELEWQYMSDEAAQAILVAFQPEYINVNYYDYKALGFVTKRFYVGDRNVSSYSRAKHVATIAFNIIER